MVHRSAVLLLIGIVLPVMARSQDVVFTPQPVEREKKFSFNGQLSALGSYAPDNDMPTLFAARYLPEASYYIPVDSLRKVDFFASANLFGNAALRPFDDADLMGDVRPYRMWARYTTPKLEARIGLQKIDFGSATVLRPLQWFNRVNPRDPLGITDGVYAALGRYYFSNNANVWLWTLYGNRGRKGFEALESNSSLPEVGGRIQYPVPRGEVAFTYHYRAATFDAIGGVLASRFRSDRIPEHRYGVDAKWDLNVGIWLECSHIEKKRDVSLLTHQTLINVGADYTLGLGSGLNVAVEHLLAAADRKAFEFAKSIHLSALVASYQISFFDRISALITHNWRECSTSAFVNYEHQFRKFAGYVMLFYNPPKPTGLIQNEQEYAIVGPGIRLMLVYNH